MVFNLLRDEKKSKKRKEKESVPMNKISRKGFLKIAAAAAMSGVTNNVREFERVPNLVVENWVAYLDRI